VRTGTCGAAGAGEATVDGDGSSRERADDGSGEPTTIEGPPSVDAAVQRVLAPLGVERFPYHATGEAVAARRALDEWPLLAAVVEELASPEIEDEPAPGKETAPVAKEPPPAMEPAPAKEPSPAREAAPVVLVVADG